ncbi:hypothetical protein AALA22_14490 [Anaerovoracaceae bacterium 41-7]
MAIKKIDFQKVNLNEGKLVELAAATAAADGFAIDFSAQDERTVFLFQNSGTAAATVKVKQGNGIQGVTDLDAFSIAAGSIAAFRLDSGAFKQVTGENKGTAVFIPSSTDVKAAVIVLP